MKTALMLAVLAVTFSSLPLAAHQASAAVQQNASASAAGTHAQQSANANAQVSPRSVQANGSASAEEQMRPVKGELVSKLDSKSAKVGEQVVVKTSEKVRTADGTVIPKGSRLIGRVTEVQAHEKGHADSSLGIAFDRAELKGGQAVAIHSVIESIAPSASAIAASSMDSEGSLNAPMAPMGGGAMGGGQMMGGGRAGGGGLLGGAVGGAASATGNVASGVGTTAGSALGATGNLAGDATAGVGNGVRGATSATSALGAHASSIPGVMLESGDATSASGVLSASRRNIHLDSGTQMVLGIAAAARQ
jgi:hypothetical protein